MDDHTMSFESPKYVKICSWICVSSHWGAYSPCRITKLDIDWGRVEKKKEGHENREKNHPLGQIFGYTYDDQFG